jgi:hypothetical protein
MPKDARLIIGVLDHGIPSEFDSSENFRAGVTEVTRERDVNLLYFEAGMLQDPLGFESQINLLYDLVSPENAPA